MPMKITARRESDVPQPAADGKVNEDMEALKAAMAKLPAGTTTISGQSGQSLKMPFRFTHRCSFPTRVSTPSQRGGRCADPIAVEAAALIAEHSVNTTISQRRMMTSLGAQ